MYDDIEIVCAWYYGYLFTPETLTATKYNKMCELVASYSQKIGKPLQVLACGDLDYDEVTSSLRFIIGFSISAAWSYPQKVDLKRAARAEVVFPEIPDEFWTKLQELLQADYRLDHKEPGHYVATSGPLASGFLYYGVLRETAESIDETIKFRRGLDTRQDDQDAGVLGKELIYIDMWDYPTRVDLSLQSTYPQEIEGEACAYYLISWYD